MEIYQLSSSLPTLFTLFHLLTLIWFIYVDCTLVHSKFIAPLPSEVDEFVSSLCKIFPKVLDVNYLMKKSGTMKKVTNIRNALSYVNTHFLAPVDMEIPDQGQSLYLLMSIAKFRSLLIDCFIQVILQKLWKAACKSFITCRISSACSQQSQHSCI